jgi:hypothetical protein
LRVVVADDHPVFRDGLAMILTERGVEVVAEVTDGQGALDATAAHHPDVVLMDLTMPGLGQHAGHGEEAGHRTDLKSTLETWASTAGPCRFCASVSEAMGSATRLATMPTTPAPMPQKAQRFVRVAPRTCVSDCSAVMSMGFLLPAWLSHPSIGGSRPVQKWPLSRPPRKSPRDRHTCPLPAATP